MTCLTPRCCPETFQVVGIVKRVIGLLYGMGRLVGQGKRGALRHRGSKVEG